MPDDDDPMTPVFAGRQWFATTHWTVVLRAREQPSEEADLALDQLCRIYWYPLYSYLRRKGHPAPDAQDLTQGFFEALIEKRFLESVDRRKGKFRSFLASALNHYVADQQKHARRLKRGGGNPVVALDMVGAEGRFRSEESGVLSADRLYERRWALTVLERVLGRLEREFVEAGKGSHFELLQPLLLGERPAARYRDIAAQLATSEGAVKVAVHRIRQRFQALLREEIAHTVATPEQVDEEIDELIGALRG